MWNLVRDNLLAYGRKRRITKVVPEAIVEARITDTRLGNNGAKVLSIGATSENSIVRLLGADRKSTIVIRLPLGVVEISSVFVDKCPLYGDIVAAKIAGLVYKCGNGSLGTSS